jgi:hypothetical protein
MFVKKPVDANEVLAKLRHLLGSPPPVSSRIKPSGRRE